MAESYISELGDSLSHGVANTNGDRVKIIAPKLYNDGNGNHPSIATALSGKSSTSHTHSVSINGSTKTIAATGGTAVDLGRYTEFAHISDTAVIGNSSPAADCKTYFVNNVSNGSCKVVYCKNGTEYTIIFSKQAGGAYGTIIKYGYASKYIYILRYQNSVWQSEDWETIMAEYATKLGTSNVGSDIRPIYLSSGTPTGIYYSTWKNRRVDSLNALGPMWYVTEGAFDVATDGNVRYVALAMPTMVSSAEMALMGWKSNSPFFLHIQLFNFTYSGKAEIIIKECNGYPEANISKIITRWSTTSNTYTVYFEMSATATKFRWRSTSADITSELFSILTKAEYDAITTNIYASVDVNRDRSISTSKRNLQRGKYDVIDSGDVLTGATSSANGDAGIVPAPSSGQQDYVLLGSGSWAEKAPKATVADTATKVSTTEDTANYLYILGVDSTDSNFNVIKRDTRLAAYGGKLMFTENSKGNYLGISGGQDASSVYSYLPPSGGTMISVNSQTEINMAITDNYNKVEFNVRKYAGAFAARETPIDDYYFYRGLATTYNPDNNIESNIHAGKYTLSEKCTLQFNTTTNALDFVFA